MTAPLPTSPRPDWRSPILLQIGAATTVGIRVRQAGSVLTPGSGSVSVYRAPLPGGALHATVALTPGTTSTASIPDPGVSSPTDGWDSLWSVTIGTTTYEYRQRVIVVGYVPTLLLDDEDLYREIPELRHQSRIPAGQTDWNPQIEEAGYSILQALTSAGRQPWLSIDGVDLRAWHLAESLARASATIISDSGYFSERATFWRAEARRLADTCRITYYTSPDVRTAQSVYRCAPADRSGSW